VTVFRFALRRVLRWCRARAKGLSGHRRAAACDGGCDGRRVMTFGDRPRPRYRVCPRAALFTRVAENRAPDHKTHNACRLFEKSSPSGFFKTTTQRRFPVFSAASRGVLSRSEWENPPATLSGELIEPDRSTRNTRCDGLRSSVEIAWWQRRRARCDAPPRASSSRNARRGSPIDSRDDASGSRRPATIAAPLRSARRSAPHCPTADRAIDRRAVH
jgi:hypothetical protein